MQSLVVGKLLFSLFIFSPGPNPPETTFIHECKVYKNSAHIKRTTFEGVSESEVAFEFDNTWPILILEAATGRMEISIDTDIEVTSDYSAYANGKKIILMDSKIGEVGHYNLSSSTDKLIALISEKCN